MKKKSDHAQPLAEDQHLFQPPPIPPPPPPPQPMLVCGEITVRLSFEADMEVLVRRFAREYEDVSLSSGRAGWERPRVFLAELVGDHCYVSLGRQIGLLDTNHDEPDVDFVWTEQDTLELFHRLRERPTC